MQTPTRRPGGAIAVLLGAVVLAGTGRGSVVTRRLGTGLKPDGSATRLPEAWVAPAKQPPTLDGRLEEAAWSATRPFLLGKLESRGKASPETEVRLLRHDRVLYVGVQLAEPNPAGLKRTVTEHDGPAYRDDSVELFLSPDPAEGYFQIILSAGGGIYDRHGHGDPADWDSGAKAAVAIGDDGWSLEAAVPMSSLGIGEQSPRRWRANVYRNRQAGGNSESQAFSPTLRGDYDVPERFAHLLLTPTSPWAEREAAVAGRHEITVQRLDDGRAVLTFDLSKLPAGTRVYRARLLCRRRPPDPADPEPFGPVQVYTLQAPYQEGTEPEAAGGPLELVAPWYRSFEMTDVVRRWVAEGRTRAGLYVKSFPGWQIHATYLDVMFEGPAAAVPPQVGGLEVFHRAGQTFITFRELDDPVGRDEISWGAISAVLRDLARRRETRYCIYRNLRPITAANLHQAELIAEVEPLSGWNLNGRNIARPIDRFISTARVLRWHQWNPFQNATIDGDYGRDCPIDRFVIAEGQRPLPRGTGLYVHTVQAKRKAYYAVVSRIDGVENTLELGPGNSLQRPVEESVAWPQPVLQGELPRMPFFNYRQRRLHYVCWVGVSWVGSRGSEPPCSNRPSDYYNWSVGVPDPLGKDVPLELNLHRDGYAYWRTHYRIEPGSIVLCPHDFPLKTWWFGYHQAQGTLRPWRGGTVRNYTEARLLRFVQWAAGKWPVDRKRILVTGCQGGASGSGALRLALRYPQVFNMVIAGHGEAEPSAAAGQIGPIWGRVEWGLKVENGRSVWEELDLVRAVKALPPSAELPFVSMTYSGNQGSAAALAEALVAAGRPVITHTAWGGDRMIPVSATATNAAVRLDVRQNHSMLAVHAAGKVGDAVRNGSLLWQTDDLVDRADRYEVTLRQDRGDFQGTITLRRLQGFRVRPGATYAWKCTPLESPAGGGRSTPQPQQGQVTVGGDGLLTIHIAKLAPGTYRMTIIPGDG